MRPSRESESSVKLDETTMTRMSLRTQALIVTFIVTSVACAVTAFSRVIYRMEQVEHGQTQLERRAASIENKQEEQHDRLILMDQKLDYLVDGRRGKPPGAQP